VISNSLGEADQEAEEAEAFQAPILQLNVPENVMPKMCRLHRSTPPFAMLEV
jgi:hypothetical protein